MIKTNTMKAIYSLLVIIGFWLIGCDHSSEHDKSQVKLKSEIITTDKTDFNFTEKIFLPVYSDIYFSANKEVLNLTVTISISNIDPDQTIYILKGDYYNTDGEIQNSYINKTAEIGPLKTINLVVDRMDTRGGTGANFIFEWGSDSLINRPLIQAVMITTVNQQGISFVTEGIPIKE